jgi:tetratricopeptide (TPR) repeat protein
MRHSRILFLPGRNLFLLALGILLLGRPLAAQEEMDAVAEQGPIRGVVRDATTGREIPDAKVSLSASAGGVLTSEASNSNGQFTLDSVPRGSYILTVEHPDYLPLTQQLNTDGHPMFGLQLSLRKMTATPGASIPAPPPTPSATAGVLPARATGIPRAAQDAMNRGMELLYVKSDARGSLDQFESAIREYPAFYEAYNQIGLARTILGDNSDAEKAFRKAIELSQEKYADAYAGLTVVLSNGKHYSDAEAAARKLIELSPNDWRGHGELARALHGMQRYQDAEAPADLAAKLAPDNATLQLLRSSIHLQLKNLPAMLDDLDAYLKLVPSGPDADRMRDLRAKVKQAIDAAKPAQP